MTVRRRRKKPSTDPALHTEAYRRAMGAAVSEPGSTISVHLEECPAIDGPDDDCNCGAEEFTVGPKVQA